VAITTSPIQFGRKIAIFHFDPSEDPFRGKQKATIETRIDN